MWLKGGNVLNGHHSGGGGSAGQQQDWPEDELGEANIKDLADIQVRDQGVVCVVVCVWGADCYNVLTR